MTIPPVIFGQSGEFDLEAIGIMVGGEKSFRPRGNMTFDVDVSAGIMGFHAESTTSNTFKVPMFAPVARHVGSDKDGCFGVAELNAVLAIALSSALTVNFGLDTRLDVRSPRPSANEISKQDALLSAVSISLIEAF